MNKKEYRKALVQFMNKLIRMHSNAYYLVVTFIESTPDDVAERATKELLHVVNQKLYGRRYEDYERYIEGVITRERQINETMHYNLLMAGHGEVLPGYDELALIVSDAARRLKQFDVIKGEYTNYSLLDKKKGCLLQPYTYEIKEKLESYVTKNFEYRRYSSHSAIDSVGFIKGRDLTFGSDYLERSRSGSLRGFYNYQYDRALRQSNKIEAA